MQTVKWDQPRYEIDPENKLFWRKEPRIHRIINKKRFHYKRHIKQKDVWTER